MIINTKETEWELNISKFAFQGLYFTQGGNKNRCIGGFAIQGMWSFLIADFNLAQPDIFRIQRTENIAGRSNPN